MKLRRSLDSRKYRKSSLESVNQKLFFSSIKKLVPKSCPFQTMMRIRFSELFFELHRKFFVFLQIPSIELIKLQLSTLHILNLPLSVIYVLENGFFHG